MLSSLSPNAVAVVSAAYRIPFYSVGTSFDKVVKVTIYAANSAHFRMINEVYAKYFKTHYPTRTFVTVGSWPMEFDVEIECMALA